MTKYNDGITIKSMTKPNVFIRSDRQTIEGLKKVAGDRPVARLLRDIASGSDKSSVPANELEVLRSSILKQLEEIKEQIAGLDDAWFRSFLKHEKDVLFMTNVQALMLKVQDKINPGAWEYVMSEAERITKEDWQGHLKKNGITEVEDDV